MKLLPLIVASAFVMASSSSYAQDEKTLTNDLETCIATAFELQEDLGDAKKKHGETRGAGVGMGLLVEQLKKENKRLEEQNKKLTDSLVKIASATK